MYLWFLVDTPAPTPFIESSDSYLDHIIIGQNVSLICSVTLEVGVFFNLRWIVPNEQKIKVWCLIDNLFGVDKY